MEGPRAWNRSEAVQATGCWDAGGSKEAARKRRAELAWQRRERARRNVQMYRPDANTIDDWSVGGGSPASLDESAVSIKEAILSSLGDAYCICKSNAGDDGAETEAHHICSPDLSLAALSLPSRVRCSSALHPLFSPHGVIPSMLVLICCQ